jgi:small subunit ribosomal protein S9
VTEEERTENEGGAPEMAGEEATPPPDEPREPSAEHPMAPSPEEQAEPPAEEPPAEEPAAEAPPAEEPAAPEPPAEEPPAEEPAAEAPPAEEPAAPEPPVEEPASEPAAEAPPAEQPAAEAPPAEAPAAERRPEGAAPARPDLPPGAELDPITLEPERELSAEERARLEAEAEERARREAEATAERSDEPVAMHEPRVQLEAERLVQATGKRKTSVARVLVRAGSGEFRVNGRTLDEYFARAHLRTLARQALVTTGYEDTVDVQVRVHGGGISGQAGAIGHGVARALTDVDPDLRGELKRRGLLTRDARIKERRKAGLKKARKRPQFSKR